MLEQKIEKLTLAVEALTIAFSNYAHPTVEATGAVKEVVEVLTPEIAAEAAQEAADKADEEAAAKKKLAAKKKAAKEAKALINKKADAVKAKETKGDAEAKETEGDAEVTLDDCRTVATYIMKVKKDKAGLGDVLKTCNTPNISGYVGDPADFLAALEECAGKTLEEIAG